MAETKAKHPPLGPLGCLAIAAGVVLLFTLFWILLVLWIAGYL